MACLVLVLLIGSAGSAVGGHVSPPAPTLMEDLSRAASQSPGSLPNPVSYSALGDSITPAFDANGSALDAGIQPYYSYAVGWNTSVFSIYERLERLYGPGSVTTHLLAVPGDKSQDMIWQAQRAVQNHSGFVTVMIGGNDLCDHSGSYPSETLTPTSVANFSSNLNQTFTILRQGLPASTVIALANVVNVSRLAVLFAGNSQAQTVYSQVCPALLSGAGIALLRTTQQEYNAAEVTIAQHFNLTLWDMGALNFNASDVNSLDYFHPSIAGHQMIAQLFWSVLPYAKMLPELSAPTFPSSLLQSASVPLQVSARDVVPAQVEAVVESPGSSHWTATPLTEISGVAYQGIFAGTIPSASTATPGLLRFYFEGNDTTGTTTTLPLGAPATSFEINVTAVPTMAISQFGANPAVDRVGAPTNLSVTATGGVSPYHYAYAGLPFGCMTGNVSVLECRPAATGNYTVRVYVNDSSGRSASATTPLTVLPVGVTLSGLLIDPSVGTVLPNSKLVLAAVPACSGGSCPPSGVNYTWTLSPGHLGNLSGTTGEYTIFSSGPNQGVVTISVEGTYDGAVRNATSLITVSGSSSASTGPSVLLFAASPLNIALGNTSLFATSVTGGETPYGFLYRGLPPGCVSQDAPALSCTPSVPGIFSVEVTVTDAQGRMANATAALIVTSPAGDPVIAAFTASPDPVMVGATAAFTVAAFGGIGTLTFNFSGLPPGCAPGNLDSFSCVPQKAGVYSVEVNVTDSAGHAAAASLVLTVRSGGSSAASSGGMNAMVLEGVIAGAAVAGVAAVVLTSQHRKRHPPWQETPPDPARK